MKESILARGQIIALGGEAYRGVRQRFHSLLLQLNIDSIQAALLTSEFSNFYRSLPNGEYLNLNLEKTESSMQIRISWEAKESESNPNLGRRLHLIEPEQLESGDNSNAILIQLDAEETIDTNKCQEILDQRSSEELSHEVSATSDQLKATSKVLSRVQEELNIAADIQRSMLVGESELNLHLSLIHI